MKIRRKTDNIIKDIPDNIAPQILEDPNFEEVIDEVQPSSLDGLADFGRGAVQGLTLGTSDEIIGGIQAGAEKLGGLVTGKKTEDLSDLYRKYQQASQQANIEAEQRSPTLYNVGEIGAGVGAGFLSAGAALPSVGLRQILKQGVKPALSYLAKAGATGATLGAAQSAATSTGNLDNIESRAKLMEDIKSGAEFGGKFGIALPVIGATLSKTKDVIGGVAKDYPFFRQLGLAYERGKTKPITRTDSSLKEITSELSEKRTDLTSKLMSADELLGKEYESIINSATSQNVKVPLAQTSVNGLTAMNNLLSSNQILSALPETNKLNNLITKFSEMQHLSPREAVDLKMLLREYSDNLDIPGLKKLTSNLINDLDDSLKNSVKGFEKVNELLGGYRGAVPDVLLDKNLSSIKPTDRAKKVEGKIGELLSTLNVPGTTGLSGREKLSTMANKLAELEQQNPGLLQKLGINSVEELEHQISKDADLFALTKQLLGHEPHASPIAVGKSNLLLTGATTGIGKTMGVAQTAGRIAGSTKSFFNMPNEQISNIGTTLVGSDNKLAQNVGQYLLDALANKDTFKKNSALFIINQNPSLKNLLPFLGEDQIEE